LLPNHVTSMRATAVVFFRLSDLLMPQMRHLTVDPPPDSNFGCTRTSPSLLNTPHLTGKNTGGQVAKGEAHRTGSWRIGRPKPEANPVRRWLK
jgi:hypothetical protein